MQPQMALGLGEQPINKQVAEMKEAKIASSKMKDDKEGGGLSKRGRTDKAGKECEVDLDCR